MTGIFVKECLMAVVEILCPEKEALFSNVSISGRTVTRRIEEMSADVKNGLRDHCKNFQFFSIALDGSTDTKDTAQLAVFTSEVNSTFNIVEEYVRLVPIKGTTTAADIPEALVKCTTNMKLDLSKLVCVKTNGMSAMVGEKKGLMALLQRRMEDLGIKHKIRTIHCIIHQEALFTKFSNLKDVVDVVLQGINQLIHEMCGYFIAFETKQQLWECQLEKSNNVHFPKLQETKPTDTNIFLTVIRNLRTEFSSRFADIRSHTSDFRLTATPFDVEVDTRPD
ncbi:general transcription factor II-I repeat domain-containing protein 2A-like [Tachypleus tridentatus]|uniref:general transcription factor II-I repeat domain-containing protein 2A-like n=1 Tax=Tachypleus tridentatus TaxID=6853 RepID=UPI003FD2940A